jgi:predicted transcriptional regulator
MSIVESSPKHRMLDIIESQPEDSSFEEILRELALARVIELGLADLDAGRIVASEEVKRRIESWQG